MNRGAGDQAHLRVGVDVGGTFTKAVAVDPNSGALEAAVEVPTSHQAPAGVAEGAAEALGELIGGLGAAAGWVEYVAFSTTQAMNALLEGDVPKVGIVGLGAAPELRVARRRTRIGDVALAPGRVLHTDHEFIDASQGLSAAEADAAIERLADRGCEAIAISGAYAVDGPAHELLTAARVRERGLPCCSGHELSGAYGLETRTVSAAVNAAILPVVERTAGHVEAALAAAGVEVPLLVLRGDGGAMGMEAFRRRPSFTVGSGPAAGVAAALQALGVADAIVLESGGTSSNVSVIVAGRPALRSLRVMGRPTAIRSIDSWVVGAAGGSMARIARRRIAETGPRSAHIAGLPYACFSPPAALEGAALELTAPRVGDPAAYAVIRAAGGRFAVTVTCAANALGLVPGGAHSAGDRASARLAFEALAKGLRQDPEQLARCVLDGAAGKVARAAEQAARDHRLGGEVPLVALGGAGEAIAPLVAKRLKRELIRPDHPEVLSAIGAAMSLVRAEVARSASSRGPEGRARRVEVAAEAERECVAAGAAPATVRVETRYDHAEGLLRAVATGAVALEAGAARRPPASVDRQLRAAASELALDPERLSVVASSDFYRVYSENGSGKVAVVDAYGGIACSEGKARRILTGSGDQFLRRLRDAVEDASISLGVTAMIPRVTVLCGPRLLDFSDARDTEEIEAAAEAALSEHRGEAVALVAR